MLGQPDLTDCQIKTRSNQTCVVNQYFLIAVESTSQSGDCLTMKKYEFKYNLIV